MVIYFDGVHCSFGFMASTSPQGITLEFTQWTPCDLLRHDILLSLITVQLDSKEHHGKHLAFALPVQLPVPDRSPGRRRRGARILISNASGGRRHLLLPATPPQEPGAGG